MTAITDARGPLTPSRTEPPQPTGLRIEALGLGRALRDGTSLLAGVSLTVEPGELVAIIGASGAGKTTLLELLAGVRRPSSGALHHDGRSVHDGSGRRSEVGVVPQDDIIHRDLPVRSTLRHAARLRLPGSDAPAIDAEVRRTMATLGLTERASTRVDALSGGQRKRVSIAVELLTRPRALFLDEPTSGLDPGTARSLLTTLRAVADSGSTVVLTTHDPDDLRRCDRIVVLARGGRLVHDGSVAGVLARAGVDDVADLYPLLDDPAVIAGADARFADARPTADRRDDDRAAAPRTAPPPGRGAAAWHQWRVLCRRNVDVLVHNRLTLAIMLGAPALVVAMFVVLFRPGAFHPDAGDPAAAVGTAYWLAFAAFFFGLTYGLLQICTEAAVVRRERHVGLGLGAYVLAKAGVLLPVLLVVNAAMVAALRATGRLPAAPWRDDATTVGILLLDAAAALTLGLLASAAVTDPSHATLALPMLCFPAVLFGGAVLPVHVMATAGRAISVVTPDRWAFEALGRHLGLADRFAARARGAALTEQYGGAFSGSTTTGIVALGLFTVVFGAAAVVTLRRRTAVR